MRREHSPCPFTARITSPLASRQVHAGQFLARLGTVQNTRGCGFFTQAFVGNGHTPANVQHNLEWYTWFVATGLKAKYCSDIILSGFRGPLMWELEMTKWLKNASGKEPKIPHRFNLRTFVFVETFHKNPSDSRLDGPKPRFRLA